MPPHLKRKLMPLSSSFSLSPPFPLTKDRTQPTEAPGPLVRVQSPKPPPPPSLSPFLGGLHCTTVSLLLWTVPHPLLNPRCSRTSPPPPRCTGAPPSTENTAAPIPPPPHYHRAALVSPHHRGPARCHPWRPLVPVGDTLSPPGRRARLPDVVTALYARAAPVPWANFVVGLGQQAEAVGQSRPITEHPVFRFSIFDYISRNWYKLQKCVENIILLKIWNKFL
jgi:hypothetical protein